MDPRRSVVATFRFTVGAGVSDEDVESVIADAYAQFQDPVVRDAAGNERRLDVADLTVEGEP